ncbi:hypothetical protein CN692_16635 [Bacillus sp. AFS002410]|uniref:hypothetical protein n=1 Tax=Bacillus sp. AFS002410 TaxID=2033481 RepID=UPI000BEF8462|nr:hypothetical protein [Bacillus sp. AFS002410]PEJ56635.1 hypothetical protein CN692_16635 [Bacillus sp. AFS002410]
MRKWCLVAFILILLVSTVLGCSNKLKNLTRIEYIQMSTNGTYSDPEIVTDKKKLEKIERIFSKITWEENVAVKRKRIADIKATLFYEEDKNMPERLYEYDIWFHSDINKAVLIGDNNKQSYAMLNKELSKELKELLNYGK